MNILKNQMERIAKITINYRTAMKAQKVLAVDKFMAGKAEIDLLETAFAKEERSKSVVEGVKEMVDRIADEDKYTIGLLADLRGTLEMMMDEISEIHNLL